MARPLAIFLAVAMLAAASGRVGAAPRAADGTRLLDALERAQLAVVGRVVEPRRIDLHGYTAGLRVESRLAGEAVEAGATLRIAWEELSRSRAPRFDDGDRILVGLERLPGGSLWRQRFPEPGDMTGVLAVGQEGQAFLRSPSLGGLRILEHYLALSPEDRRGAAGVRHLTALAAQAEIPLALSAARRLAAADHPDRSLDSNSATLMVRALVRRDATPEFQSVLLGWIEDRRPEPLRPALEAALNGGEAAPPILFVAMGLLDGELSADRVAFLMEQGSTEDRAAAARFAPASQADRLASLARADREPEVRAAALTRLLALRGEAALEEVLGTLADPDPSVRMAAAQGLGSLGAVAVPRLRDVVEGWPQPAPQAAVWALRLIATREAVAALREIAATHPDDATRTLAEIAIGKPLGDRH